MDNGLIGPRPVRMAVHRLYVAMLIGSIHGESRRRAWLSHQAHLLTRHETLLTRHETAA